MAWPVYSVRFITASEPDSWYTYTCPAGYRAVVRQVAVVSNASAGAQVLAYVAGANTLNHVFQAANADLQEDVRWVFYSGEQIGAFLNSSSMWATLSGFLFRDPTGGLAIHQPVEEQPRPPAGTEPLRPS